MKETVEEAAKRRGWNIQQVLEVDANEWIDAQPHDIEIHIGKAWIAGFDKGNANGKLWQQSKSEQIIKSMRIDTPISGADRVINSILDQVLTTIQNG